MKNLVTIAAALAALGYATANENYTCPGSFGEMCDLAPCNISSCCCGWDVDDYQCCPTIDSQCCTTTDISGDMIGGCCGASESCCGTDCCAPGGMCCYDFMSNTCCDPIPGYSIGCADLGGCVYTYNFYDPLNWFPVAVFSGVAGILMLLALLTIFFPGPYCVPSPEAGVLEDGERQPLVGGGRGSTNSTEIVSSHSSAYNTRTSSSARSSERRDHSNSSLEKYLAGKTYHSALPIYCALQGYAYRVRLDAGLSYAVLNWGLYFIVHYVGWESEQMLLTEIMLGIWLVFLLFGVLRIGIMPTGVFILVHYGATVTLGILIVRKGLPLQWPDWATYITYIAVYVQVFAPMCVCSWISRHDSRRPRSRTRSSGSGGDPTATSTFEVTSCCCVGVSAAGRSSATGAPGSSTSIWAKKAEAKVECAVRGDLLHVESVRVSSEDRSSSNTTFSY